MITIPTCELVGLLTAAISFAAPDKEDHWFGVHLEWDGELLHASGYDTLSGARITWAPYSGAEAHDENERIGQASWGGSDDPWKVFIDVLAAKEIVKTFKLAAKHALTPVNIKISTTGSNLIVERSRETGHSEHFGMWPSDPDRAAKFPNIAEIFGEVDDGPQELKSSVQYNPLRLAAFGAVNGYGTMRMAFGVDDKPTVVSVGTWVCGFIYPAGTNSAAASTGNILGDDRDAETEAL